MLVICKVANFRKGASCANVAKQLVVDSANVVNLPAEKLALCKCPPDFYVYNKLYRRSMLERLALRFAENVQYEDVEFVMRALCESGTMVTVPGVSYRYVLNPSSTVNSRQTPVKQAQKYAAHKAMVEYFAKNNLPLKEKYRNLTVRHFTLYGVCLWKIKEKGARRVLRLFDVLPVCFWTTK